MSDVIKAPRAWLPTITPFTSAVSQANADFLESAAGLGKTVYLMRVGPRLGGIAITAPRPPPPPIP